MKRSLLEFLVCPLCRIRFEENLPAPSPDGEYLSGSLVCPRCSKSYPIVSGVPRLVVIQPSKGDAGETFGFEWLKHGQGRLEGETVFGRTQEQDVQYFLEATRVDSNQIRKSVILDVGCGSGQLTEGIGKLLGARTVIGVDVHAAIEYPFQRCRALPNVHIVQANIEALPFKQGEFDLVWSNGVIHHTPRPEHSFACLSRLVRRGGTLYIWVYERRWSPFRFVKDLLDKVGLRKVPLRVVYIFCKIITVPSFILHLLYRAIRWIPFLRPSPLEDFKTRHRTLKEIELTWFDALSPRYVYRYTEEEIKEWFLHEGFQNLIGYEKNKIGVCGVKVA